jgi:hypothetical protein
LEDRPGPAKPPSPSGRVVRTGGVRGGFRGETRTACGGDGEAVQAGRICGIVEGGGVVWGAAFSTDPVPPPQGFDCSSSVLPPVGTRTCGIARSGCRSRRATRSATGTASSSTRGAPVPSNAHSASIVGRCSGSIGKPSELRRAVPAAGSRDTAEHFFPPAIFVRQPPRDGASGSGLRTSLNARGI